MKIMQNKIATLLLISGIVLLNACKKNSDVFVPDPGQVTGPDTNWVSNITASMPASVLKASLSIEPYRDSFEINANSVTITTPFGLECTFTPNCAVDNSGPVTGKVYVELLLVKKKGDMIRMDKPTTSDGRLLVSGGEIFVNLSKNGNNLHLAQGARVYIRYQDAPVSTQMKFFNGDESSIEKFNWIRNLDSSSNIIVPSSLGYQVVSNSLRWINCDYFYDSTNANRTKVQTELPSHFTNANTNVYMVFNDMRTVMGMYGDPYVKKFISGKVPVGKAVTIVVLSKQGNDLYLGKQTITTAIGVGGTASNQNVSILPVKTSKTDILAYLGIL